MRLKAPLLIAAVALAACGTAQPRRTGPPRFPKIAVRPFQNRTQQFGLEDPLTARVLDEFQRDGTFKVVPEAQADGVVVGTLIRYIVTPIQYDSNLVPTTYTLQISLKLEFIDHRTNQPVWAEPEIRENLAYTAPTIPGGLTEQQASSEIWDIMATDIVKRVDEGDSEAAKAADTKPPAREQTH